MPPTIAIVGSVDPTRATELELANTEQAPAACAQLGEQLALRGFHIIVFHSAAIFVEGDVVKGYIGSDRAAAKSIQVRYPEGESAAGSFPAMKTKYGPCFEAKPLGDDWEVSFYRALKDADGVLLIGGGRTTLIAGLISVSFGKPTVAISSFGGKAREVRRELERASDDVSEAELQAMVAPWSDESARVLVSSLFEQPRRRSEADAATLGTARREGRNKRISGGIAALATLLALAGVVIVGIAKPGGTVGTVALLLVPVFGGISGAIVRNVQDDRRDWWMAGCLGLIAGVASAALFVASQLATSPDALENDGVQTLAWLMLVIGLIAGLTTEQVFGKLRKVDIADVTPVDKP